MPAAIARTMVMDGQWQPLADSRDIAGVTLTAPRSNASPLELRINGGVAQQWPVGVSAPFSGIDLARLSARGQVGDRLVIAVGRAAPMAVPRGSSEPAGPALVSAYWQPHSLWLVLNFSEPVEPINDVNVQLHRDGRLYAVDSVGTNELSDMILVMMYDVGAAPGALDGVIYTPDDDNYFQSAQEIPVAGFSAGLSTGNKPQPIGTLYRPGDAELDITFDMPLRGAPGEALVPAYEFTVVAFSGPTYVVNFHSGAIAGDKATLYHVMSTTPTTEQPPSVTYHSSRPVLFSLAGAPVDPFAGFPLTVQEEEGGK
jgi:hypothetical protein